MSRIDDDRDAAREAERLAKQRQEEARQKDRQKWEARFAERLAQSQTQQARGTQASSQHQQEQRQLAQDAEAQAKRKTAAQSQSAAVLDSVERHQTRRWLTERVERWRGATENQDQAMAARHQQTDVSATDTAHGRSSDDGASAERGKVRQRSADAQSDSHATTGDGQSSVATDADGGNTGDQGRDSQERDRSAATFRLNPALMAPVPVARPKETSASERLRALANEIAQKIVERVRIGTNASGIAEFQIDLRSNVLSGLQIQISGTKGRVSAVFSGRDRQVLQLLRSSAEGLKKALEGRGLKVEALRIEERP